jgi:DNA-binding response OmpR family regulator
MSEDLLALVIEDDFDASVIYAKALEVLGFKTEVIASGEQALERLKVVVPDIIVLDLHLPEVLGTSILRTVRDDKRLSETLVIIATADPRSADLVQDMADLVLIKPTTFSQVRDLAARLTAPRRKKHAAAQQPEKTVEAPSEPAAELIVDLPGEPVAEKAALMVNPPGEPAAEKAAPHGEKPGEPAAGQAQPEEVKTEVPPPPPDAGSSQS